MATKKTNAPALLTDAGKITTFIEGIARRGKKFDSDVQLCAMSVLQHIDKHGDITLANKLFLAMPGGSRRASLALYLMAFGKLAANTGDNKKDSPFVYDKSKPGFAALQADAVSTTWHTMGPPEKAPDEVFDLLTALNRLLARAHAAEKVSDPVALARVEELAKTMTDAAPRSDTLTEQDNTSREDDAPRARKTVVKAGEPKAAVH